MDNKNTPDGFSNNNHDLHESRLIGVASDVSEDEDALWLQMERERQERAQMGGRGPMRGRQELPRRISNEDVGVPFRRPVQPISDDPTPPNVVPFARRTNYSAPSGSYTPQPDFLAADVCPHCKGSGWLRADVPVTDPNFGRTLPCECKIEEQDRQFESELRRISNIDHFVEQTFETFNTRLKGVRDAYEAALKYAQDNDGWLMLVGGYGCGKTHLAAAITNMALKKRSRAHFAVVPDLLDYLRAAFDPNSETRYDERFDLVKNVPLLVLDDLGTENTSPWAREKLYQIINYRYNARLATVITTNKDFDQLDGRIASRIKDRALCKIVALAEADDYRMRTPEEREKLRQGYSSDSIRPTPAQRNPRPQSPRPKY